MRLLHYFDVLLETDVSVNPEFVSAVLKIGDDQTQIRVGNLTIEVKHPFESVIKALLDV